MLAIDSATFSQAYGDEVPYLAPAPEPTDELELAERWRDQLEKALGARIKRLNRFDAYYRGRHSLRFATEKFRKAFGFTFREFADNFCAVVVDSLSERLRVEGLRMGEAQTRGDSAAWKIWQRNGLDADSEAAHTEAFIKEQAYGFVWWDSDDNTLAQITIEDPCEVIVACAPENRRKRLAAIKKFVDEDGKPHLELYLPQRIYKWFSPKSLDDLTATQIQWQRYEEPGESWPLDNRLGVVPIVPLRNKPRLRSVQSEVEQVIPLQDYLNKLMLDMAVASEYAAFRQRWATGIQIPIDPVTNQPIEELKQALDRVWVSKDPNSRFGDFGETDLGNYVKALDTVVQHIAVQTRTPQHYFGLSGQFPSGDALKAAEAPLVRKAQQRALHFGEAWEEVLRLAFAVEGDKAKASVMDSEVIWGDFEIRNEAQVADALLKLQAIGVPDEALWERAGFTPQQIDRFKAMRAEEPAPPPAVRETLTGTAPPEDQLAQPEGQRTESLARPAPTGG